MTNPAKFIGKKPRKYTVPVPLQQDAETSLPLSHMTPASRSTRSSVRGGGGRGQGVDPIAAQAAAAAQVRTYRDNGIKHSASAYNRVRYLCEGLLYLVYYFVNSFVLFRYIYLLF